MGEETERREKRWHYAGFEPDKAKPLKSAAVAAAGAVGKELATKAAQPAEVRYNGDLPVSLTFGPAGGCGAGWYDECGNVLRVGVGTTAWAWS